MEADTSSLHELVAVLKTTVESRKTQKFAKSLAARECPLLRKAGMEQVRRVLLTSTAVKAYADGGARLAQ